MEVKIESSWKEKLYLEFKKQYFLDLVKFIKKEHANYDVFPPGNLIFNAFNTCPFQSVRVVILGQDPYHGLGQAHGLSFSVPCGVPSPPSLNNIFKEIYGESNKNNNGNLIRWSKQGVLLLNSILTVRRGQPSSHSNKGWERFTDEVVKILSRDKNDLVFMLWGAYAHKKGSVINRDKHLIIETSHPSPFSFHKSFKGSGQFDCCNRYLISRNYKAINW